MCACFYLETGPNKFFPTSAQMGISCIKCVLGEVRKANSQNSQPNQFSRKLKYILPIKLITNLVLLWKLLTLKFDVQVAPNK